MTKEILKILYDADGAAVSGQQIGEILNCSRMSVTNNIAKLRELGLVIESGTKSGHRLLSLSDVLCAETVSLFVDVPVYFYDNVDSTFFAARTKNAPCVVAAAKQSGGYGRRKRSFVCEEGGVYFNYKLVPDLPGTKANLITLASGVAVVRALESYGVKAQVKYPNDCYADDKKICGIMTECTMTADEIDVASIGIGINVFNPIAETLRGKATSMKEQTQSKVIRAELIGKIVNGINHLLARPQQILTEYRQIDFLNGKSVILSSDNEIKQAEYKGIDQDGYMTVLTSDGMERVTIGEVSVSPKQGEKND